MMRSFFAMSALLLLVAGCNTPSALAPTPGANGFDASLTGWRVASTGGAGPKASWAAVADGAAISPPNVMAITSINHRSEARFNLFWTERVSFADGRIAVAVRGDDGVIDMGGGPMWRVQDEDNYYVCRFNPLELNLRVYVVEDGVRRQLDTAIVDVEAGRWHRVVVEHDGDHIVCALDGKPLLDVHDDTISAAGGVGLWTKADARTSFDDLVVDARR